MVARSGFRGSLEIGKVVGEAWAIGRRNGGALLTFALLVIVLPAVVSDWVLFRSFGDLSTDGPLRVLSDPATRNLYIGVVVVVLALNASALAGLVHGALVGRGDGRVSVADCVTGALRNVLPIAAVGFVVYVSVVIGALFLLVPGIMIAVAWSVALQVQTAERPRWLGALRRSGALTKGHRWAVFGVLTVYGVVYMIVSMAIGGLFAASGNPMAVVTNPALRVGFTAFSGAVNAVATLAWACLGAALYGELRRLKDGGDVGQVFD